MVRAKRIIHMPTGPDYYGSMNGRLVAAFAAMSVDNDLAVILITGHGDIAMAVNVMREVKRAIAPLTDAEIDAIGEFGTPGAGFTIGCTRCCAGRTLRLPNASSRSAIFDAGPAKACAIR
jgi:hypothetical protein